MDSDPQAQHKPLHVLITGGTGFIGSHLMERLVQIEGLCIHCFVRAGRKMEQFPQVSLIEGDLLDPGSCRSAIEQADILFHVGGLGLSRMHEDPSLNEVSTRNLLQACAADSKPRTFVYVSSIKAVRPSSPYQPVDEETSSEPSDVYGWSKKHAEDVLHGAPPHVRVLIIRPPLVFGPRDQNLLPIFNMICRGIVPIFANNKGPAFSIVYVKDLVEAMVKLTLYSNNAMGTLFIANAKQYGWNDLMQIVAQASPYTTRTVTLPLWSVMLFAKTLAAGLSLAGKSHLLPSDRVRDILEHNWVCSVERASRDFQISCQTDPTNAFRETWSGYMKEKSFRSIRSRRK